MSKNQNIASAQFVSEKNLNAPETFSRLLEKVRNGDASAQSRLYVRFRGDVLACCRAWASAKNVADEIYQDVFMEILKKVEDESAPTEEKPFCNLMLRITRFRIKDYHARDRRRQPACLFSDLVPTDESRDAFALAADEVSLQNYRCDVRKDAESADPNGADKNRKRRKAIFETLRRSSRAVRKAFWLSLDEEKTSDEIAEATGLTAVYVRKIKSRTARQVIDRYENS